MKLIREVLFKQIQSQVLLTFICKLYFFFNKVLKNYFIYVIVIVC